MPTLLIVRPAGRAVADMQTCREAGWYGVPFSLLDIVPDGAELAKLADRYAAADGVFWVSPSAVQTGIRVLDFRNMAEKPNIAVGAGSAAALRRAGCTAVYAPEDGNDSEAVLELDVWETLWPGAEILIVRGCGGRTFLADELAKRGFAVSFAEIYRRVPQPPDWQAFAASKPDAIWINSSETVDLLFGQMPAGLVQTAKSLLYFTHHPRIMAALRSWGAERIELIGQLDVPTLNRFTEQAE